MDLFIENQRRRLLKQKEKLLEVLDTINESGLKQSMRDATGELSMYDNDPADIGSELFEREKDLTLKDNTATQIKEIDQALHKIEEGTYGVCASCGNKIPRERLEAVPYATLCVDCKEKEEQHSNQVHSGAADILQRRLSLMQDNDAAAKRGETVDFPNIYDDWDQYNGWVEPYENIETEFDETTGMFVAKNPPQAGEVYKDNRE